MGNNDSNRLNERSLEHEDATGFFSRVKRQAGLASFKKMLLFWLIGAMLYAVAFHLLYGMGEASGLYVYVLVAAVAFLAAQLPTWRAYLDSYVAGERLSRKESLGLLVIRIGLTVGASLIASYYLISRLDYPAIPIAYLIAAALVCGHVALCFISYPITLYIIFGLLTTVVSITSFNGMNLLLYGSIVAGGGAFGWVVPKAISWVLAVLFAYVTNRNLVFRAEGNFWHEMFKFFLARIASGLLVEFLGLFILENLIGIDRDISNLLLSIIVVIVNYVFSRLFVFSKK